MILLNSKKIVYVRPPKTGSTSAFLYFMNSGLFNKSKDVYALDLPFNNWKSLEEHFYKNKNNYLDLKTYPTYNTYNKKLNRCVHISFNELKKQVNEIDNSYVCYSTIRNPIERICALYNYEMQCRSYNHPKRWNRPETHEKPYPKVINVPTFHTLPDMNEFCYIVCSSYLSETLHNMTKDQHSFFPKHSILWNTENLHEHAKKDLLKLGGKVNKKIHVRHKTNNIEYKKQLSTEVIDMITKKYCKDFELWEKAYAVYN